MFLLINNSGKQFSLKKFEKYQILFIYLIYNILYRTCNIKFNELHINIQKPENK